MQPSIQVTDLKKTFKGSDALKGINFTAYPGEMVALIGASGSGKSTLIRHIAGLLASNKNGGEIKIFGNPIQSGGTIAKDVRKHRRHMSVIFQQFNLVSRMSVLTNVLLGTLGTIPHWRGSLGLFTKAEKTEAMQALHRVGMAKYATQRASTLSGGQQQRVAIARALMQNSEIILADEPIASLDPESSRKVMESLARIHKEDGKTVIVSLHQVDYAMKYCPRVLALKDGRKHYDGPSNELSTDFLCNLYGSSCLEMHIPDAFEKQDQKFSESKPAGGLSQVVGRDLETESVMGTA